MFWSLALFFLVCDVLTDLSLLWGVFHKGHLNTEILLMETSPQPRKKVSFVNTPSNPSGKPKTKVILESWDPPLERTDQPRTYSSRNDMIHFPPRCILELVRWNQWLLGGFKTSTTGNFSWSKYILNVCYFMSVKFPCKTPQNCLYTYKPYLW